MGDQSDLSNTMLPPQERSTATEDGAAESQQPAPATVIGAGWDRLPTFVSHKRVNAAPILTLNTQDGVPISATVALPGDKEDAPTADVPLPADFLGRGYPNPGDMLVIYDQGEYVSWSPRKTFANGYTLEAGNHLVDADGRRNEPGRPVGPPQLGVIVHTMPDGSVALHGIEPDGTEHAITMPAAHGAYLAFEAAVRDWFIRLGERSSSWSKQPPETSDGE